MQFKYLAAALLSASAVIASPAEFQKRQDLGDVIASGATSVFGEATSAVGDAIDTVTSKAPEIGDAITSRGAEVIDTITSKGADVAQTIASGANSLATRATSAIGSEVTGNDDGAALSSFQAQQTLLVGAAFIGAFIAL
ncbi:hypothetical protein BKA70DRAFT_1395236 [Coprinopsis sp. MPI-PUGE-AT-0042]|nr:hypothetical protein BKA70DRAFT_1395236 [Coprinopsis sp. MPI-PUGE-AT-0042]